MKVLLIAAALFAASLFPASAQSDKAPDNEACSPSPTVSCLTATEQQAPMEPNAVPGQLLNIKGPFVGNIDFGRAPCDSPMACAHPEQVVGFCNHKVWIDLMDVAYASGNEKQKMLVFKGHTATCNNELHTLVLVLMEFGQQGYTNSKLGNVTRTKAHNALATLNNAVKVHLASVGAPMR